MLSEKQKTVIKQHWKMNKDSKTVYYAWICSDRCLVYIYLCCIKFLSMILDCLIFLTLYFLVLPNSQCKNDMKCVAQRVKIYI